MNKWLLALALLTGCVQDRVCLRGHEEEYFEFLYIPDANGGITMIPQWGTRFICDVYQEPVHAD